MRLYDFLDYWARERPDGEFAVHGGRRLTYREAVAQVNRIANALSGDDLPIGSRCVILAKNCIEYALLYYAAAKAGVVPVPLNYRSASQEWRYIIADAGASAVIAQAEYRAAVDALRPELPAVRRFIVMDEDERAAPGWEPLAALIAAQPATPPDRDIGADDDLYQLYTSGTTGHPKGAVLTHRAVTANLFQIGASPHRGPAGERSLVVAPMCHAAVVWTVFAPLSWGASLYIETDFEPQRLLRVLDEERIGYAVLVPTVVQSCLANAPDVGERRYEALRCISCGSAPLAEATLRRAVATFGCDFMHAYGMTESTGAISAMTPDDTRRALSDRPELILSAGRPLVGTELRIVDEHDAPVPVGTVGEIVIRGPQVMRGYWHLPDATEQTLRGGWLHTGDAGRVDEDGYLFIQDRIKDMVVSGGVNVYPRMVEEVLVAHPAIAEVAVIGVPDAHWGETLKAVVVLRPGARAGEAEIIDFCRDKLGGFQRPRSVAFVEMLPRSTSGKVLKRVLREPYWTGQSRRVAGA